MKTLIDKLQIIAEADIRNGDSDKLKALIPGYIKHEYYEACEGIKRAFDNQTNKEK